MGDATALREKQTAAYAAEKADSRQLWLRLKREWQGASCKQMLRSTAVKETCALKNKKACTRMGERKNWPCAMGRVQTTYVLRSGNIPGI